MKRILVIGLDAADLDLIGPWAMAGYLPHIASLLRNGTYAPMRSTLPVMSPPAWTSMISGLNPGKHGIYDFVRLLPGSYRLTSTRRDQTNFQTIFDYASEHGHHVLALNIPITYPPAAVHGVMVAGLGAPTNGKFTHPPELRDELLSWGYRLDLDVVYEPGREQEWLIDLAQVTRSQTDAMLRLMQREPWDLAMLVYRAIDEVETFFWHHMDPSHPQHDPEQAARFGPAILKVHRLIDEEIGRLLALAGPDTIVVLASDHGGGAAHREVFLNIWLEQQGWLRRRQASNQEQLHKQVMRRLGLTRENLAPKLDWPLAHWVRKQIPMRWQHRIVPESSTTLADVVDWSQTRAYSFGNIGQIFVNLRGREPEGIVAPGEEYELLLDELSSALFTLQHEGKPVVDAIYRRKDIYHGPYADYGPDLNVIMRGMSYTAQSWREMAGHEIFAPSGTHYTGIHRPLGMVALSGPMIPAHGFQAEVQIVDLAPTLLWLMGLPISSHIDGRLLHEFIEAECLAERQPVFTAAPAYHEQTALNSTPWATVEEEAEVLERLRSLGYLE